MKAVSGKDMCKALERQGWHLGHVRGSHHIYEHPNRLARLSVPVHAKKTLSKGMQHSLMKDAGLTEADL